MDYAEKITEFVRDEKKIVTYRWLSLALKVSSNRAKQILHQYLEESKGDADALNANYFISGIKSDEELGDMRKVCVVKDEDVEKVKSSFKSISSVHIYSIQEASPKDLNILYGVDFDVIKNNLQDSMKYSSISCPGVKFTSREKTAVKTEPTEKIKSESTSPTLRDAENKENQCKNVTSRNETAKPAKGSIASMFSKQPKGAESKKVEKKGASKPNNSAPKKNPLAGFLAKGAAQPKPIQPLPRKTEPIKEDPAEEESSSTEPDKATSGETERRVSPRKKKEEVPVKTEPDSKISQTKEKAKTQANKNKSKTQKSKANNKSKAKTQDSSKRKRIVQPFDSSDESETEEPLVDECPFPSPAKNVPVHLSSDDEIFPATPTSPRDSATSRKRKRRKLVDKTYQDEDGFLVTKKEFEMVSESDEENPLPSKSSPLKTSPKKQAPKQAPPPKKAPAVSSPKKNKQSSIMNFFKKK